MYFAPEASKATLRRRRNGGARNRVALPYPHRNLGAGNPPGLPGGGEDALADVDPNLVMYGVASYSKSFSRFCPSELIASLNLAVWSRRA